MIPTPEPVDATVVYEPLFTQLMSATMIGEHERYGGVGDWVVSAANQLGDARLNEHLLLFRWIWMDGWVNAVEHGKATQSFDTFIEALATMDAVELRDKLLAQMIDCVHLAVGSDYWAGAEANSAELLQDFDTFSTHTFASTRKKYDSKYIRIFHHLLNHPAELQQRIVAHLRSLWQSVLKAEWERVEPRIRQCVDDFQAVSLNGLTMLEAIERVTGRDLRPAFRLETLLTFRKVRFVPHLHNGPYIIWFGTPDTLYIGFQTREPVPTPAATFDRTTLANRCKALADETRLAILLALAQEGEMSTGEIIGRFELDKSAASRHLRQLVATSLIEQQRVDKAKKAYRLNQKTFTEVVSILRQFSKRR